MNKRVSQKQPGKQRKKVETGIDEGMDQFFFGGEWKSAGFVHHKPPRWTEEYQKMSVSDLFRRTKDDLEEPPHELILTTTPNGRRNSHPIIGGSSH